MTGNGSRSNMEKKCSICGTVGQVRFVFQNIKGRKAVICTKGRCIDTCKLLVRGPLWKTLYVSDRKSHNIISEGYAKTLDRAAKSYETRVEKYGKYHPQDSSYAYRIIRGFSIMSNRY